MFSWVEKAVLGMVLIRILSGLIEISAALIMLRLNQVDKALMVNATLALIGPLVLISTTAIGLIGLAEKLSFLKILTILSGVALILYAIRTM